MAAGSFLALLDDIATVLDDVAVLSKVAVRKTAGVLGDDLALNAEQVAGVAAQRELPVVWAVAKGSLQNKAILVPTAFVISALAPMLVMPLMMVGGGYLCFEGVEKLHHAWAHRRHGSSSDEAIAEELRELSPAELAEAETVKIKGAVRTDFVLSAEIIVLSLGIVTGKVWWLQLATLVAVGMLMTVGVYGLVAAIVKLDDVGLYLARRRGGAGARLARAIGQGLVQGAPWLMRGLSVAGTVAMFLVGGGIIAHGVPVLGHWEHESVKVAQTVGGVAASLLGGLASSLYACGVGLAAGALLLLCWTLAQRLRVASRS